VADRLSVKSGDQHLIEVSFDNQQLALSRDFRPELPLIIHW